MWIISRYLDLLPRTQIQHEQWTSTHHCHLCLCLPSQPSQTLLLPPQNSSPHSMMALSMDTFLTRLTELGMEDRFHRERRVVNVQRRDQGSKQTKMDSASFQDHFVQVVV